jgi:type IV fimbrial biogenesis protein FimT
MTRHKRLLNEGFTLFEMLIVIAVSYIILGIVAPSAKRILDINRIAADINHTSALVRYARTLAISQIETIKLCPASDHSVCDRSWQLPIIVFADSNSNNIRDDDEPLLASGTAIAKHHKMSGPKSPITFRENGTNASPASITLCPVSNDSTLARAIYISLQGRTRLSQDYNNDGIHERVKNTNLNCDLI